MVGDGGKQRDMEGTKGDKGIHGDGRRGRQRQRESKIDSNRGMMEVDGGVPEEEDRGAEIQTWSSYYVGVGEK